MTKAEFMALPWLVFEHHVTAATGYASNTIASMVDRGVLARVKPKGCGQARYQKAQLGKLLGVALELGELWEREPLLMSEKDVMRWTGYSEEAVRKMAKAGGLEAVRPAGSGARKYRKEQVAKLIGAHV